MERNLLEREIAALEGAEHFFTYLPLRAVPKVIMFPTNLRGKVTEVSFLRQADLKTKEKTNGKDVYYLPNQWIDILGEKGVWFLVEGTAAFMDGRKEKPYPGTIKGWIKKDWVIHKIPPKLDEEPKAGTAQTDGYTCYVEIDLKITDRAYRYFDSAGAKTGTAAADPPKMTAIYVPQKFQPNAETDLIIYLHGFLDGTPGILTKGGGRHIPPIQYYLNYVKPPATRYFNFREIINQSGKSVVFVAPTLGGKAQYGNLVNNFDNYVDQVIWAVNEHIYRARNLGGQFKLGNIILAAHSGGGSAMLGIAGQSKSTYARRIKSFWGFDSWYNGSAGWNAIVDDITKNKKTVTIYAYKYNSGGVPKEAPAVVFVTAAAKDRELVKAAGAGVDLHFPLLPFYFEKRVQDL